MDIIAKLLGEWSAEFNAWSCLLKIALATVLAMLAGTERATKLHSAGIKTFISVALAGVSGSLADVYLTEIKGLSVSLLSPAIIIGVAVISTNTILFSSKNQLRGLTTSVGLWCVGIIAMIIGYGMYFAGVVVFALVIKWLSPNDTIISVMNQALKLLAVLAGTRAAVRGGGSGVVLRGAAVGLAYMAVGVIGYAFLSGLTLSPAAYLADLGMGVAAGGLFGMVLPKRA